MTVISSKKNSFLFCILKENSFFCISLLLTLNIFVMPQYISSVLVVLSPKKEYSSDPLVSKVFQLDVTTGSTTSHAIHFVSKSPLVKPYLSKYNIVGLTFKYSAL